jgi:hypothetical protein
VWQIAGSSHYTEFAFDFAAHARPSRQMVFCGSGPIPGVNPNLLAVCVCVHCEFNHSERMKKPLTKMMTGRKARPNDSWRKGGWDL